MDKAKSSFNTEKGVLKGWVVGVAGGGNLKINAVL